MNSEVTLLPCPFCGKNGELHNSQCDEDTHVYWVQCRDCGAVSGQLLAPSIPDEEFAVAAWNTRAVLTNCTCSQAPGAACNNCPKLPPLPKVSGYGERADGHYSAQAMRAYAADAIAYSRNFASAKPNIGETEKQHILGLCSLLERQLTTPPASGEVVGVAREQATAAMEWKGLVFRLAAALNCLPSTFPDGNDHLLAAIDKLSAAPKQAVGWRPIADEPDFPGDHSHIVLVYEEAGGVQLGQFTRFYKTCNEPQSPWCIPGRARIVQPTHWQELPSPPEKATDGGL